MTEAGTFRNADLFPRWRGQTPWRDRARAAAAVLHERFPALEQAIQSHPFARFEAVARAARGRSYTFVPRKAAAFLGRLGPDIRAPYLCSLLLWHMEQFDGRFSSSGLDPEFALHYADSFNRIIDQIVADPSHAAMDRDSYLKDLWIARVVMVPAVAQVWWPHSGLSLRQLMSGGGKALAHCLVSCGGRRPFLEGHTHDAMVAQGHWSADGWAETLRLAALVLAALPSHRGVFSTAWYFDPVVARISPRLDFVANLQVGKGGRRFRVGSNESAMANATAKSPTRRRLRAEGSYVPTDYCIVWARRDLIAAYAPQASIRSRSYRTSERAA